ncbi:MAG: CvpA family protein [Alphaproteobacteria bacterium]|nr:CvpA family protein [Romboutsia sp.]USO00578.1 MAG: CvpA family protein [Alphaproteobacteria bacterium]
MYDKSLDVAVLLLYLYFSFAGFISGFIGDVLKNISVLFSLFFSIQVGIRLHSYALMSSKVMYYMYSFGIPIIVFFILGYILSVISVQVSSFIKKSHFSSVDKFLGVALGMVKAFILSLVAFEIINHLGYGHFTDKSIVYKVFTSKNYLLEACKSYILDIINVVKSYMNKIIS